MNIDIYICFFILSISVYNTDISETWAEEKHFLFIKSHQTLFLWVYRSHYTFNIMKMTLILKIHRYWHLMSDTIWILYIYVISHYAKISHSQCDAGGEAAVTLDQQQNDHMLHILPSIQKLVFMLFSYLHGVKINKILYQISLEECESLVRHTLCLLLHFEYMFFHVLQVENHDPVMKCCL